MTEATHGPNRPLGIALGLAAAVCLGYALLAQQWLANDSSEVHVGLGLLGGHSDERTIEMSNFSGVFPVMGKITFVACLIAAIGLLAAAVLAIGKKRPELPVMPTTLAMLGLIVALITGCIFVSTKPGFAGMLGVGNTFFVFGAGAVLGIAGALMLGKINRPVDPDLMADAMDPEHY